MILSLNLSEFLSRNVREDLYPTMFLMTCSGTLLSYSNSSDVGDLRSKAAILSQAWSSKCPNTRGSFPHSQLQGWLGVSGYLNVRNPNQLSKKPDAPKQPSLEYLTIETTPCNIIIKRLQDNILLVLFGTNPPDKKVPFKLSVEFPDDARYPSLTPLEESADVISNENCSDQARDIADWNSLSPYEKDIQLGTLHIQRKKLDLVASHLETVFAKNKLVLPANGAIP